MDNLTQFDAEPPGGVYLCQFNENVSCGACCGLYNVPEVSLQALEKLLVQRTNDFASIPAHLDAVLKFKADIQVRENHHHPYPEFHHCPFIGLIGNNRSRVGCLLHPQNDKNNGIDFRGLSYYGGMACRSYFCPTYRQVPKVYKQIVREAISDWFLYGLIITDAGLLNAFFSLIERRLGRAVNKKDIFENARHLEATREFLQLRLDWPFRMAEIPVANYFFEDRLYLKPPIDYNGPCAYTTAMTPVFYELCSRFKSKEDLERAEKLIADIISKFKNN